MVDMHKAATFVSGRDLTHMCVFQSVKCVVHKPDKIH